MEAATLSVRSNVEQTEQVERLGAVAWAERADAASRLAEAGHDAVDALIAGTQHSNWRVRRGCADLMDHLADDRCTASLIHLLDDPVEAVRRLALHALSCQGCKTCSLTVDVVAYLIRCIETDTSVRVRRVAVHQLGCQPPDARAEALLRSLLTQEGDTGILSRARWALSRQSLSSGGQRLPGYPYSGSVSAASACDKSHNRQRAQA